MNTNKRGSLASYKDIEVLETGSIANPRILPEMQMDSEDNESNLLSAMRVGSAERISKEQFKTALTANRIRTDAPSMQIKPA